MLQGFYWDSFDDTKWTNLEAQTNDIVDFFDLVWIPQSAKPSHNPSMGYDPLYWFSDYTSSFGTEKELLSLIDTWKKNGIGTIADIVINHRGNVSNWFDFPTETYEGVTYTMGATDIVKDDDKGKLKSKPRSMASRSAKTTIPERDGMACATSTITALTYKRR